MKPNRKSKAKLTNKKTVQHPQGGAFIGIAEPSSGPVIRRHAARSRFEPQNTRRVAHAKKEDREARAATAVVASLRALGAAKNAEKPPAWKRAVELAKEQRAAERLREEARLVRKYADRFERHLGGGEVLTMNSLGCALDIDDDQARELVATGVFRNLRTLSSRLGSTYDEEQVTAAELVRFLENHGRRWFAGRLGRLIEDLSPLRVRIARLREVRGYRKGGGRDR